MDKKEYIKDLENKIEEYKLQITHLENDLSRTRREYEASTQNYFELYSKIEEKIKIAKAEANTANQARSEFLANISHELKTPLNSILGFSELLNKPNRTKTEKEYLEAIISSGEELLMLINDMVDISKIEAGKRKLYPEKINIISALKEIEYMYRLKSEEKNIHFDMNITPKLPHSLIIDRVGTHQILTNLIDNAVKFTESGRVKVSIKCKNGKKQSNKINLFIEVKDSGIGMEQNKLEEIFNAFEQKRNKNDRYHSGTGLGLTITKRLVEMMGGEISVSSKLNVGSTFSVYLPNIKFDDSVITKSETFQSTEKRKRKQTILIVDDDNTTVTMIKLFLKKTGSKILEANNGNDAIKTAIKFKPDLIITDFHLPGVDGIEMIKELKQKKEFEDTIFITVTGDCDTQTMIDSQEAGSHEFITKPFSKRKWDTILNKYFYVPPKKPKKTELKKLSNVQINERKIFAKELEEKYSKEWENLTGSMVLTEIRNFASNLLNISAKYHLDELEDWSKQIKQYAERFRIDLLNKVLIKFPEVSKVTIAKITQSDIKIQK